MSYTTTHSATYSAVDIENVFKSFKQELMMIAQSSTAMTITQAEACGYDAEYLAKNKYLKSVDITLFDANGEEAKAVSYTVNEAAGDLTTSRVGGVMWPKTTGGSIRLLLFYTPLWYSLSSEAQARVEKALKQTWTLSDADYSHSTLKATGGRDFVSNSYGVERRDYSK